ncbi:MAG: alkaline phosphatase family protein [Sphingobacteriales bacterium]|nr:alkaline phosphatase family protein [Sphingobacteriales bacterium]
MKLTSLLAFLLLILPSAQPLPPVCPVTIPQQPVHNLIIVTIDGFRWQELFTGADEDLLRDTRYTADSATMQLLYGGSTAAERRQRLLPFFWNVIAKRGQLYGNRQLGSRVNTANLFSVSYPGYNEIFTGTTDLSISSNARKLNSRINVLEHLDRQSGFTGRIAAFTSWDMFPYILNQERNGLPVNSGYASLKDTLPSATNHAVNVLQEDIIQEKGGTRHDQLTYIAAREYLQTHQPRVLFLGLGETDEYAHRGNYDRYLQQATQIDQMLASLWQWIQTTPGYKDNTTLLITTDHGRGSRDSKWTSHSAFIKGSSQTWLALMGPGLPALGEVKESRQIYQQQLSSVMAALLGERFGNSVPVATR